MGRDESRYKYNRDIGINYILLLLHFASCASAYLCAGTLANIQLSAYFLRTHEKFVHYKSK